MDPQDWTRWTPEYLLAADIRLAVHCPVCRVVRPSDPLALCAAGRGKRPVGKMRFRCTKCGTDGKARLTWRSADGDDHSVDVSTGEHRVR